MNPPESGVRVIAGRFVRLVAVDTARSRLAVAAATGAAIVLLAGVVVAATRAPDDAVASTVDVGAAAAVEPAPATSGPEATAAPPGTTAPGDLTTTTTTAPATTTTSEAGPAVEEHPPVCDPASVRVDLRTDKPAYAPGETVVIHRAITNLSGTTCRYPSYSTTTVSRGDEWGAAWAVAAHPHDHNRWLAGETIEGTDRWSQTSWQEPSEVGGDGGGEQQAPPGTYELTVSWSPDTWEPEHPVSYSGTTTFEILAG